MVIGDTVVGVLSDTHGLLRPAAVEALRGSDLIIHAGDIGEPDVLARLRELAPTVAVRGNNDRDPWARDLPATAVVPVGSLELYVLHNLKELDLDPVAAGYAAVISGHSHQPSAVVRDGVLFLNPGSAGPRRFKHPIALARLRLRDGVMQHEIVELSE